MPQGEAAASAKTRLIQLVGWYYTVELLAFAVGLLVVSARCCSRRGPPRACPWLPLLALVLTVQLVHLVYWTNARMRAPLVPVISLLAVASLRRSIDP